MSNHILFESKLFESRLSRIYLGKWSKKDDGKWDDVILKCVTKLGYSEEFKCLINEIEILQQIKAEVPDARFYMHLLDIVDLDTQRILVLQKGDHDIFEYCANMTHIDASRCMRVCEMFQSMVQALIQLHALEFTHNDVKPENFVIFNNGRNVALIDFGFASRGGISKGYARFGTEIYQMPDLFSSATASTFFKNDLFGLGMSLFVCFARTIPFRSSSSAIEKLSILRSFTTGQWPTRVYLEQVREQPLFDAWCDLVSKLCGGRWTKACSDILLHPFFQSSATIRSPEELTRTISDDEDQTTTVLLHC